MVESNGNLALFFEIPNVATSRSAESSGVTTEGSKEEYAVKSLTVYLFDSTTKTLKDQQELKNINRTVTASTAFRKASCVLIFPVIAFPLAMAKML